MIHSKFQDLVPAQIKKDDPELARPDDEAIKEVFISYLVILHLRRYTFISIFDLFDNFTIFC